MDPMLPAVLAALGVGGFLGTLGQELIKRILGRTDREANAWEQRDTEARARRILEEALHSVRLVARRHGVPDEAVGPWPEYRTSRKPPAEPPTK